MPNAPMGGAMIGNLVGVLFDGIAYGSLLFVISIGLSVTMGLMNFVNLAHGAFAMLGGYACTVLMTRAGAPVSRDPLPVAFVIPGPRGNRALERTLYQRLYKAPHLDQVRCSRSASCSWRSRRPPGSSGPRSNRCACPISFVGRCACWASIWVPTAFS